MARRFHRSSASGLTLSYESYGIATGRDALIEREHEPELSPSKALLLFSIRSSCSCYLSHIRWSLSLLLNVTEFISHQAGRQAVSERSVLGACMWLCEWCLQFQGQSENIDDSKDATLCEIIILRWGYWRESMRMSAKQSLTGIYRHSFN